MYCANEDPVANHRFLFFGHCHGWLFRRQNGQYEAGVIETEQSDKVITYSGDEIEIVFDE
jgi:hypothetical protein